MTNGLNEKLVFRIKKIFTFIRVFNISNKNKNNALIYIVSVSVYVSV